MAHKFVHTHNGFNEEHGFDDYDEIRRLHSEHKKISRASKAKRKR